MGTWQQPRAEGAGTVLPSSSTLQQQEPSRPGRRTWGRMLLFVLAFILAFRDVASLTKHVLSNFPSISLGFGFAHHPYPRSPSPSSGASKDATTTSAPLALQQFSAALEQCRFTAARAGPPPGRTAFSERRTQSDRFAAAMHSAHAGPKGRTHIVNATLWTGAHDGTEVRRGVDIILERGIIKDIVQSAGAAPLAREEQEAVFDAAGRWVTPGLVDVHVHMGVDQLPTLPSVEDTNTRQTPLAPFLRSLDGLNQHDLSFKRTVAGGITTGLVLPGSGGNIGGQAFVIKLRPTREHGPSERVVEPPRELVLPGHANEQLALLSSDERRAYDAHLNATGFAPGGVYASSSSSSVPHVPWRHIKMACGENARRLYGINRMDEQWGFRQLFERASKLRDQQDAFCERALGFHHQQQQVEGRGANSGEASITAAPAAETERRFPTELELEALVAVLRGQVKVNTHCYTSTDFESFVRLSNEFKFPVAAFHHAHEAWLVPELIKRVYRPVHNDSYAPEMDPPPAVAIFSTNGNYKMEAYFGGPHLGALLKHAGLTPLYKSDHPVTDSRRILNQAAQGHHFGLDAPSALAGVTSAAARAIGMGHRLGMVQNGYDADVVVWNTHPLRLGATPVQVWIDGQEQLAHAHVPSPELPPAASARHGTAARGTVAPLSAAPPSARYEADIARIAASKREIMEFEALPFSTPVRSVREVRFKNVTKVFTRDGRRRSGIRAHYLGPAATAAWHGIADNGAGAASGGTVVLRDGQLTICSEGLGPLHLQGLRDEEAELYRACDSTSLRPEEEVDLHGGAILPGIQSFGSNLGLTDIASEQETSDGAVLDPFAEKGFVASNYRAALQDWPIARAVDGLQWGGNDLTRGHAHGVVSSIVPPQGDGFLRGVSTQFSTGVQTRLEKGAIRHEEVAMHVALTHYGGPPSISEQLVLLRQLLQDGEDGSGRKGDRDDVWSRVVRGHLPLVVQAARASHIASLIALKQRFPHVRLIISNASEAPLAGARLPEQLAEHNIAVLLSPRTWGITWDERRSLPGPPLTKETTLSTLLRAGVKVAFRIEEGWQAANLLFDATFAAKETDGLLDEEDVVSLLSNRCVARGARQRRREKIVASLLTLFAPLSLPC
ncbi:hypothetical protein K437DRAFT_147093 [Tilletiaria anomala UBC 951]|uniref:Amidohydrolase 3 domain-containing protein n=1 Tax=Tilletiaria anomala (strain ATCC 24038 / CBS 436.72 / UBC 951) TaxID=1037660 RepID=A0A066VTP9_TILAU|nr:uncharacterized protein K437DRAFT_147093 [Tilletiaria anomala UBC 951]KDN43658.1 hypothetical protein K437DRAFT_147093 [Tilletiaria anomala UBC 951]